MKTEKVQNVRTDSHQGRLTHALQVLDRQGLEEGGGERALEDEGTSVSVHEVREAVGVSKRTLYRHVASDETRRMRPEDLPPRDSLAQLSVPTYSTTTIRRV